MVKSLNGRMMAKSLKSFCDFDKLNLCGDFDVRKHR